MAALLLYSLKDELVSGTVVCERRRPHWWTTEPVPLERGAAQRKGGSEGELDTSRDDLHHSRSGQNLTVLDAPADYKRTDAVLDRVLQNMHRIELEGESMRRPEGAPKTARSEGDRDGSKRSKATAPAPETGGAGEATPGRPA